MRLIKPHTFCAGFPHSKTLNLSLLQRNTSTLPRANETFENSVVSWTSKISKNAKMGLNYAALSDFIEMQKTGVEPNETTFSVVIGICSRLHITDLGTSLHCLILRKGWSTQPFLASGLVTFYSKCDYIIEARKVFDEMPERDVVSQNAMISAYCQRDLHEEAVGVLSNMLNEGNEWKLSMNDFTFATIFRACAGLGSVEFGSSLHGCAVKMCFDSDVFVAGSLIDMYSKCRCLDIARKVFDSMERRDVVVWNSMITGYAQNHYAWEVIELLQLLMLDGFSPSETTFCCAFKASGVLEDSNVGRSFHGKAIVSGCSSGFFVGTALVDMYSKFFDMENANRAFQDMTRANLVSYNTLITGYSFAGRYVEAMQTYINLLSDKLRPDSFTFAGLLSSCSVVGALGEGAQVHAFAFKIGLDTDVTVGNSLVTLYSKCGLMESASKSFKSTRTLNVISWAGIISGFAQNGDSERAVGYFGEMHKCSAGHDEFSFSSVLKALASCAAFVQGRQVHSITLKVGLELTLYVGTALIDMYAKCGMIEDSFQLFSKMTEKNVVSWNSMILAYAQNGFAEKSLLLFQEMLSSTVSPTAITFTAILLACSHAGLIEDGKQLYSCMVSEYKIQPSVEHCTCMVDLLGRSGYLDDAETFILCCPFASEPGLWKSLLSACGVHKNMGVAARAAEQCLKLEPYDSAAYITLSNIYASKQLWHEVTRVRYLMREMGIEKEPGCSWIGVGSNSN